MRQGSAAKCDSILLLPLGAFAAVFLIIAIYKNVLTFEYYCRIM